MSLNKKLSILGIRGIPAAHGGFETFAEQLSLYLVRRGWDVTVYCQEKGEKDGEVTKEQWCGVNLIKISTNAEGAFGTIVFDWRSIEHARLNAKGVVLTLGYNTASFCFALRLSGKKNIINMDGLEWKRDKWKLYERGWLWLNERLGCYLGDHLVADHPEIARHLMTRVNADKITTIPYGAPVVACADESLLSQFGVSPQNYLVIIARAEPENSIFEIVKGFSRSRRNMKLLVLGKYDILNNSYHKSVVEVASDEVVFVGAIYDKDVVHAIRYYCRFYVHGHRVGGTNPSLVEALGAGSAIIAHDNRFNRWVAGKGAIYFDDQRPCDVIFDDVCNYSYDFHSHKRASVERHCEEFQLDDVLLRYEELIKRWGS